MKRTIRTLFGAGVFLSLGFGAAQALPADTLDCVGNVVGTCTTQRECKIMCEEAGYGWMSAYCDATTGCCHCDS